jgi:hypothetical protein
MMITKINKTTLAHHINSVILQNIFITKKSSSSGSLIKFLYNGINYK